MADSIIKTTICVLTATRAEYGLLKPLILALRGQSWIAVEVAVTGMHLSHEFGLTYRVIEEDGIDIAVKIPIVLGNDTPADISKSMGLAMIGFADYFEQTRPDLLIVLGDRYETLAVCCAAVNARIPIAHLYGGETTQGAVDEAYRHAITKMSQLHFTSTEEYRNRVIQMGESPERVFAVGAIGVENALHKPLLSKDMLGKAIGFTLDKPYAVVTFHPVTLEEGSAAYQCRELLVALDAFVSMKFIITKANADAEGRAINAMLDRYAMGRNNVRLVDSLGDVRYLSALKHASCVVGNSSSGLVEAPSFGIPTVNIGDRQKGRIQAESVLNCKPERLAIVDAINRAISDDFRRMAKQTINPYGDGNSTSKVMNVILATLSAHKIELKKAFYDIHMEAGV